MGAIAERKAGPLTFGVEIEIHVPVLLAPENDTIQKALEFPTDDWYQRNCLFYTKEDGRKIPVVKEDVQVNKEARKVIGEALLELLKETMEKPDWKGSKSDLRVMTAELEHPSQTFKPTLTEQQGDTNTSGEKPDLNPNVLGEFVDGHYEVYDMWTVCQDGSGGWYPGVNGHYQPPKIPPIGPEGYSWLSIEIKSQVYKNLDLFRRDLKKVCDRIRARFLVSINCGQGFNRSSTHVHVGRSGKWDPDDEDLPFNLLEAKKMATAMYMLEPALTPLHAPWKKNLHRYAARLRGYSYLGSFSEQERALEADWERELAGVRPFDLTPSREDKAYTKDSFSLDKYQRRLMESYPSILESPDLPALRMIWGADDMTQLAWLVSCRQRARRGAFALHGLARGKEGVISCRKINTIEFRHMHGSLDAQDIMNWVRIIETVVSSSVEQTCDESYERFLRLIIENKSGIDDILEGMGLKLVIKSAEQIAEETLTPGIPVGENDEQMWRGKGSLMFLSKPSATGPRDK
ncbi:hypothetical protein GGR53DRAFT_397976 [Hypoxylon sp. FL1150]|nr:hypothetical protein GGR53DRAFT_397976 [Hypoxylon sp. FL1150]